MGSSLVAQDISELQSLIPPPIVSGTPPMPPSSSSRPALCASFSRTATTELGVGH